LKFRCGERRVLQVSGQGQVSTLAKIKLDLYHPANNAVAYQLVGFWDEVSFKYILHKLFLLANRNSGKLA